MIRFNAIIPGESIVRDPEASGPPSKSWFRLISKADDKVVGQNISTRSTKVFGLGDLRRLEPARDTPACELDLTAILGKKVAIGLAYGKNTGVVTELHTRTTSVFGEEIEVPVGISIDGEIIRWPEVQSIELA